MNCHNCTYSYACSFYIYVCVAYLLQKDKNGEEIEMGTRKYTVHTLTLKSVRTLKSHFKMSECDDEMSKQERFCKICNGFERSIFMFTKPAFI